ncbi:hypothetical protein [Heyndrickxia acidicola]|uniref:hypothetical protein n=1 Tax=Heyndrickxia acidicola TaxID=209389 RepID=UPI000A97DAE4|nr:hypothetical protein [Heyndrickxia acidicola]
MKNFLFLGIILFTLSLVKIQLLDSVGKNPILSTISSANKSPITTLEDPPEFG